MGKELRIAIVGAGAIAKAYAAAIAESRSATLSAVADCVPEAAKALAAPAGARAFGSHGELADSGLCDAVIVTTPPVTHAPIAIDLMNRGLPVLCEKPISVDYSSAKAMTQAARDNGVILSMASKFRFTDDLIAARDLVRRGQIGTPVMLENLFTGVADMTARWNSDPAVSGGGVLIDNGTHSVDIIRFILGPLTKVLAIAAPPIQHMRVEDGVTLLAQTESGAQAKAETSWSLHKDRGAFVEIYGTEGAIEVGWKGSRIRRGYGGTWESFGRGYDKVGAFVRQIDHFVGSVRGEAFELVTMQDALASVAAIEAAYRSMDSGRWELLVSGPSVGTSGLAAR